MAEGEEQLGGESSSGSKDEDGCWFVFVECLCELFGEMGLGVGIDVLF